MDLVYLVKKEMFRRKYSYRTIKTYVFCLNKFLSRCHKEPREITKADVREYLELLCSRDKSASTLNVYLQAIKFACEEILGKNFFVKLPYSKIPKQLPDVLAKKEVKRLIGAITNEKHKLMTELLYSAGLRVSEVVNLRVKDFEFNRGYGWVRKGKGGKDRLFIIAKSLKDELIEYIRKEDLSRESFAFKGRNNHLHIRSVQEVVKRAARKAKISKSVHPHTLRHSFATHLIENGYDVATVQSLLGHNSAETTMVYVHMASPKMINVRSPLDDLQ